MRKGAATAGIPQTGRLRPDETRADCRPHFGKRGAVWAGAALAVWVLGMGQWWLARTWGSPDWFFLMPWAKRTGWLLVVLAAVAGAAICLGRKRVARWMPWALGLGLAGAQCWWSAAAWQVVKKVPWGFDHPSFMFRLWEFGKVFPGALGGYLPQWNGGIEHFVGVTSGAHAYGVLLWPLLQIWEPHQFYGAAMIFFFIWAFPWLGVVCARGAGIGRCGALAAGWMLCGATREFFLWMWHFGTLGAMTSAAMAFPTAALAWRLAVLRRGGWKTAAALGASAGLACLWTPGVFTMAGLGAGWALSWRRWRWRETGWLLAAGALAVGLLGAWWWTTWFPCRNVVEYVGMEMPKPAAGTMLMGGLGRVWCTAGELHPALLVLGVAGLAGLAPRAVRRWTLPGILLLAVIGGWSREWKPMSQMDRMMIPMASLMAFPAAWAAEAVLGAGLGRAMRGGSRRGRVAAALSAGVALGVFALGARTIHTHYGNQGFAPQRTLGDSQMGELVEWLRENVPEEGRVGFAGKAVHAYGGGNIAYLPVLTGREMMADDYYGFPRGTIEYDYPPRALREKGWAGWEEWSELYGITHWVAHKGKMQEQLRGSGLFESAKVFPVNDYHVEVFRTKGVESPRRLIGAEGTVRAEENRIRVEFSGEVPEECRIRYNWRKGLVCRTEGAEIFPAEMSDQVRFIGIRPGGNRRMEIGYRPHAAPVEPNFDGRFHH